MDCPAAFELVLYRENQLPERARERVRKHLERCPYCVKLLEDLPEHYVSPETRRAIPQSLLRHLEGFEPLPPAPNDVLPGQIWLAADVPGILLVAAVLENPDAYAALPISTSTAYLSDRDFWLAREDTPLGSPCMVQTWLSVPVDRQALGCFVGVLDQALMESVQRLRNCVPSESDKVRMGPPLSGPQDPRYEFQRTEMGFWRPASTRIQKRMFALDQEAATSSRIPSVFALKGYAGPDEVVAHVERQGDIISIWFVSYPHGSLRRSIPVWIPTPTGTYTYRGNHFGAVMTVSADDRELAPEKGIRVGIYSGPQDTEMKAVSLEPAADERDD